MADRTMLDEIGWERLTTKQNGRPIVWERSGVLHLCEGSRLVPFDRGTFVLWTRCQMHDVPADAAWEQLPTERVTCAACLDRAAQETPDAG